MLNIFCFSTLRIINYLLYLNIKKILYLYNKKKLMEEIWKDKKDYEGLYQVSNWGRNGYSQQAISSCCKKELYRHTHKGFRWSYIKEGE